MSSLPELLFRLKKELKDDWKHSCRVASYAKTIGVNLGLDAHQLETVWFGALVHDAGKMCIPARVLNKQGKLSDDERLMINQHPIAGWHILREFKVSDEGVLQITRSHHERIDGGGYPDRLAGNEIPMLVRVVAVADVFDALRAARHYKPPLDPLDVIDEMYADEGHFDLVVLNALVRGWQQVSQEVCQEVC